MKCDHAAIQLIGSVTWCQRCGAVRENAYLDWHLPESERREVRLAEMCPICEFGDPLLIEVDEKHKIRRWSCGHWVTVDAGRVVLTPAPRRPAALSAKQRLQAAMGDLKELNKQYMIAGGMVIVRNRPGRP